LWGTLGRGPRPPKSGAGTSAPLHSSPQLASCGLTSTPPIPQWKFPVQDPRGKVSIHRPASRCQEPPCLIDEMPTTSVFHPLSLPIGLSYFLLSEENVRKKANWVMQQVTSLHT